MKKGSEVKSEKKTVKDSNNKDIEKNQKKFGDKKNKLRNGIVHCQITD